MGNCASPLPGLSPWCFHSTPNQNYHRQPDFTYIQAYVQAAKLRVSECIKPSHMQIRKQSKAICMCALEKEISSNYITCLKH